MMINIVMILLAISLFTFNWGSVATLFHLAFNLDNIGSIMKLRSCPVTVQSLLFVFISFSFHNVLGNSRYGEYFLFLCLSLWLSNNLQAFGFQC